MWCLLLAAGGGKYRYTRDLLQLAMARCPEVPSVPMELIYIQSPLHKSLSEWRTHLRDHPDQEFADYVILGLQDGFRIGFDHASPLKAAKRNIPSAAEHPSVVDAYIQDEVRQGRMFGPLSSKWGSDCQINRMGVIPKGHAPNTWRLITDLSFPENASVNDGISPSLCSLHYTSVQRVATAAMGLGHGALLAKLDIKSAYRLLPVHPQDRQLLGVQWGGSIYVDGMLPFGLRSAAKIFTAVADAIEWIVRRKGVKHIDHYLYDFIIYGPPESDQCARDLHTTLQTCDRLGVPLAREKLEGPTQCLTFLGIEVDTREGVNRFPAEKLTRVKMILREWENRKSCTKCELQSLIGTLQHTCQMVRPGRAFLRRMIDMARIPKSPHHFVRLNVGFRADLRWWGGLCRGVERSGGNPGGGHTRGSGHLRCLRELGLRCLERHELVPVSVAVCV